MGLFDKQLSGDQTLFRTEEALDFEFLPKLLPFREQQQRQVASAIQPLLAGRNGRNLLVYGPPGVGKTAAVRWVLRDLEETSDDVYPIYINCWQKNTSFQIFVEICDQLSYKFTQNKRTDELFAIIKNIVNKKAAVFVFDEIDKVSEYDFLYSLLEEIFKRSVILVTNYKEWVDDMDVRIKSRLMPTSVEFGQYNLQETKGILEQRKNVAFVPGCWDDAAFQQVVAKTAQMKDIRSGLFLLREAALAAEADASRRVTEKHAAAALAKASELEIKKPSDLDDESTLVLGVIKEHSGQKIGDLFRLFKEKGGQGSYKTFQRKVDRLVIGGFITANKVVGGAEGTTTILSAKIQGTLDQFTEKDGS